MARLEEWQRRTRDPLADPRKLARLEAAHRAAAALPAGAQTPGFRWRYPEYLYRGTAP